MNHGNNEVKLDNVIASQSSRIGSDDGTSKKSGLGAWFGSVVEQVTHLASYLKWPSVSFPKWKNFVRMFWSDSTSTQERGGGLEIPFYSVMSTGHHGKQGNRKTTEALLQNGNTLLQRAEGHLAEERKKEKETFCLDLRESELEKLISALREALDSLRALHDIADRGGVIAQQAGYHRTLEHEHTVVKEAYDALEELLSKKR